MSSVMKRACIDSLANALRAVLPATVDVQACAADWEEPTKFPAVRVLPGKFTFEPWQEREVDDSQADKLFLEVGEFEGDVEIRISARSRREREVVEDLVMNYFLSREFSPGVQTTTLPSGMTVGGFATTYQATCAFAVEDGEWREEMAFADKKFSFLDVEAWFPALVVRSNVYTIDQLVLALDTDAQADVDDAPTTPQPASEEDLLIADDGTVTKTTR